MFVTNNFKVKLMKKYSFRSIITLTLVLIIGTISFSAFYIYSNFLSNKIYAESEKNIVSALDLLKGQFYYTIDEHDGRIIKSLLQRMDENERVLNSYLYNAKGELKFSYKGDSLRSEMVHWEELAALNEDISLESFQSCAIFP